MRPASISIFFVLLCLAFVAMAIPRHRRQSRQPEDCGLENVPTGEARVINGDAAAPNQFPWVVLVRSESGSCTGSLISADWVLTAAHCIGSAPYYNITAGGNSISEPEPHKVVLRGEEATIHPNYNPLWLTFDVAVIRLNEPAPLSDYIRVSCLPSMSDIGNDFSGELATLTGWGLTQDGASEQPDLLQYAPNRPIISNEECRSYYPIRPIDATHICIDVETGSEGEEIIGVCNGDSGGPLNLQQGDGKYLQVGVASFVSIGGCEVPDHPHGYARVTEVLEWIGETTGIPIDP